jgi:hypothetical protein
MKYTQTIKTIIVHPEGEPLFDESATHVAIDDEGGGYYLIITQFLMIQNLGKSDWILMS